MISFSRPAPSGLVSVALLTAGILGTPAASANAQVCGCTGNIQTYCTAGTSVQGCLPTISGMGVPNILATSGFDLVVSHVPGQRFGTIFYGFYSFITPWAPGSPSFKCVASPVQRMGNISTGGTTGLCNGELRLDFNAWMANHPAALGGPFAQGQTIRAQGWYRDPAAPGQTNLSNAVAFTLCGGNAASCPTPPGFVAIQPGTFLMGSNAPVGAAPYFNTTDSQPVHQVTISYGYWMGATEVTQAQYSNLMNTNPSSFVSANSPVENVNWINVQTYCAALTAQQAAQGNVPPGYEYRLPTEAEWEYACRAGTATEFNVGSALFCNEAKFWYSSHSNSYCIAPNSTAPVASYAPNPWGLYDMHGNVWEWCLDSFSNYSPVAVTDPFVTASGPYRVLRGGSWNLGSTASRSAYRNFGFPGDLDSHIGFRVVLAPVLVP